MKDHDNDAIAYVSGGLAQYIVGAESHKRYMEYLQQQPLDHDKQRQIIECLILQARSTGEATITLTELLVLLHHYSGMLDEITPLRFQLAEADAWCEYWRREALRQHPTPEAYEAVCKARDKWQERAERAYPKEVATQ